MALNEALRQDICSGRNDVTYRQYQDLVDKPTLIVNRGEICLNCPTNHIIRSNFPDIEYQGNFARKPPQYQLIR